MTPRVSRHPDATADIEDCLVTAAHTDEVSSSRHTASNVPSAPTYTTGAVKAKAHPASSPARRDEHTCATVDCSTTTVTTMHARLNSRTSTRSPALFNIAAMTGYMVGAPEKYALWSTGRPLFNQWRR